MLLGMGVALNPVDGFAKRNWFALGCTSLAMVITCIASIHFSSLRLVPLHGISAAWAFLFLFLLLLGFLFLVLKKHLHGYRSIALLAIVGLGMFIKAETLFTPLYESMGGPVWLSSLPKALIAFEMLALFFCALAFEKE